MDKPLFFADTAFAWTFWLGIVLLTGFAAWYDTRKAIIPNRLCVLILVLGVAANVARGAWLAAEGKHGYVWPWGFLQGDEPAVWVGAVQGFLFAAGGFLVAFTLMFLFWMFGLCGGGDVKLLGAVGGWVGIAHFPFIWIGSVFVLFVWMIARVLTGGLSPRKVKRSIAEVQKQMTVPTGGKAPPAPRGRGLRVTYSLPVAVATAAVLLWVFRAELQLVRPKPADQQGASAHVHPSPPAAALA